MNNDLNKTYNPKDFEDKWYEYWLKNDLFSPEHSDKKETFSIVIPPPNVTSILHMGHGLNNTIQDILIRYKRMSGYETLWIPGTDHAGIATQNVVERELAEEGKKRIDFSREDFEKRVWKTALKHQKSIIEQLKKMGCSADWSRNAFTFDEDRVKAVKKVFIDLYKKDLIYKSKYIVNWCPRCNTALSDDEVEHSDKDGKLWFIKYPIKDSKKYIVVATTRPETMLGDTAVAFNDKDKRYKNLKDKKIILPLVEREMPVIYDSFVDPEFGTGAVKVTPAHDSNDFEMGLRHNLEFINIFTDDAKMNDNVPWKYQNLDRYECRKKVVEDLEKLGLIEKILKHKHAVGECYRCKNVIEPRYSDQWFVKMKILAKPALEAVKKGNIRFFPKRWEKVYFNWLTNIKDWCISRQLWWGHRIPIYYCCKCNHKNASYEMPIKCEKCGYDKFTQDTDVLDTWFSSWLWPFSTLGWPEKTSDLKKFYPTSVLVTAPDIIFFWVARMIMAGLEFMNDVPFRQVFFTGMVMDIHGRKMSKSLGNGIDPFEVIDRHGADALRYTMVAIVSPNQNLKLSFPKDKNSRELDSFEIGTRFANKIWNASRFILMNMNDNFKEIQLEKIELDIFDKWIFSLFNNTIDRVNHYLESAKFNDAATTMQNFFWHHFCDWYIELSKSRIFSQDENVKNQILSILIYLLREFLKLLHPIMPYITEEIYQILPNPGKSIMITKYPVKDTKLINKTSEKKVKKFIDLIYLVRNIRWEMNVPQDKKIEILIKSADEDLINFVNENDKDIVHLAKAQSVKIDGKMVKPSGSATGTNEICEVYIPLEGIIDINKEVERLKKELEKINIDYIRTKSKLQNSNFISKAPEDVIEKEKMKMSEFESKMDKLKNNLALLKDLT